MLYSSTSPEGGHRDQVMSLKFSQDGGLLASSSMEGEIKICDVPTGDLLKTIQGGNCTVLAGFHKNNNKLFSGSKDGTIRCWDVATGKELVRLMTFADDEWLALTPEGYYNASPNAEKYLRVQTPQGILPIETHKFHFHRPGIIAERLSR